MIRVKNISTILLFVLLISSCATDRVHSPMKKDLECKTIKTRYDYGRKRPIKEISSAKNKRSGNLYNATSKSGHNNKLFKKITSNGNHSESTVNLQENQNQPIMTDFGKNEQLLLQPVLKSFPVLLTDYEIMKLPDPAGINNQSKGIFFRPSQKSIETVSNSVKPEKKADIRLNEYPGDSSVSLPDAAKSQDPEVPIHKNEAIILMMAVLAGLIPFTILKSSPKLTSDISFWAAMNPWKTRFLFAGVQIAMGAGAFILGEKLANNGVHFSALSWDLLFGTFLFSSILYPSKNTSIILLRHTYLKQKAFDLALAVSGFMLMVNTGNDPAMRVSFVKLVNFNSHEQQNATIRDNQNPAPVPLLFHQGEKKLQQEQTAVPKKERTKGENSSLTVLVVLLTIILGLGVAAASCSLYCNGMGGLAALTAVGGGALVILLAIWMIKSIWHPKQKNKIKNVRSVQPEKTFHV